MTIAHTMTVRPPPPPPPPGPQKNNNRRSTPPQPPSSARPLSRNGGSGPSPPPPPPPRVNSSRKLVSNNNNKRGHSLLSPTSSPTNSDWSKKQCRPPARRDGSVSIRTPTVMRDVDAYEKKYQVGEGTYGSVF